MYAADGGVLGEVAYVVGHLLGRTECALCDVTHRSVRRKPEWDAMTSGASRSRLRLVAPQRDDGRASARHPRHRACPPCSACGPTAATPCCSAADSRLTSLGGSVDLFEAALLGALATEATPVSRPVPEPVGPGQESVWDYPRPPRVEPTAEEVEIWLGGVRVRQPPGAAGARDEPPARVLPAVRGLRAGSLRPSEGTSWCEFKGAAAYHDVTVGMPSSPRAWNYPDRVRGFESASLDTWRSCRRRWTDAPSTVRS